MTPWYRQFWPWFLIAFPAASVVAGITTVFIATYEPDGLVVEDYYRQGLAINQDLARQRAALELGLAGELKLNLEAGIASLRLEGLGQRLLTQVNVRLVHPTRAHKDLAGTLHRDMTGRLSGPIGFPQEGSWRVVIEPPDEAWRLTGRMDLPEETSVRLQPG